MSVSADNPVHEVIAAYPADIRVALLQLRSIILEVAAVTEGVGPLVETLKWGQPSYLTDQSKSGTTIRIDRFDEDHVAVLVNCQTSLIDTFRGFFPDLQYSKTRAIVLRTDEALPLERLALFVEMP